ncbi:MAG: DUF4139 domain-containing protein [Acidobacteriota bacterium]
MRPSLAFLRGLLLFGAAAVRAFAAPSPAEVEAGAVARQEIVVTNQNVAVVSETRSANLPAGEVSLVWTGVPSSARTETWSLTNAPEAAVRLLGLSAPLPSAGLLVDLVGKRVRVERPGGAGSVEAEVVAVSGATPDQILFREDNGLVYGEPGARLVLLGPAAGPGRVTLRLSSERAGERALKSRYLVSDIDWQANYALTLAPDEKSGRLEGWFTIDNRSGVAFAPARLRLLAGVLRVASAPAPRVAPMQAQALVAGGVEASQPVSESRMYEVASPGRLAPGRAAFRLAENAEVPIEKRYVARTSYWFGENAESQTVPVAVIYRVGARKLAAALPAGVVRIYVDAGSVFAGEDRIGHIPEKTDFDVESSEAFDLTARRRQTSFTQTGPRESESAWEVTIASRKTDAATVIVRDSFPGDWSLVESSVPASQKSARVVEFPVPVAAGGEVRLTYRVRVRTGR